jgi:hypothetical protein
MVRVLQQTSGYQDDEGSADDGPIAAGVESSSDRRVLVELAGQRLGEQLRLLA